MSCNTTILLLVSIDAPFKGVDEAFSKEFLPVREQSIFFLRSMLFLFVRPSSN
jgi:hypothetical protein